MTKTIKTSSLAETKAKEALTLRPFLSISLENIKDKLSAILNQIGNNGIFREYTKHDISHIDAMLNSLEWLIPNDTKEKLTSSEWLMIVLSIYFHDLGMLVTYKEFNTRTSNSNFNKYKTAVISGEFGTNFSRKIQNLKDDADNFLYQEFVRRSHAERIKNWILDKDMQEYGASDVVIAELRSMLGQIDNVFKKDLAMICESHHLDDLYDVQKYKYNQSYGRDKQEQANLQYCAVILRTADLIHITSDRTPSIEYRLISPNDPISQIEWSKQMAVKNVREKYKCDKEGNVDRSIQPDTIEVSAYFDDANKANSFFGLIDYLAYAKGQLSKSHTWITESNKRFDLKYNFPWKDIDDTQIETEGFERKLFEFILDQQKILNLLVGHTLYNDPTVVIRELVQNSIDAIKLNAYIKKTPITNGRINIKWNENERILTFQDNGIGMTQDIIERHLLKVGSSRYQDESFKKEFPDFSAISRFGIGILTCFLISDDLDIETISESEEKAKKISIRKVDGKYLLQHIDKSMASNMGSHGTKISLNVRQDVEFNDIEESLRKWILYPPCTVELEYGDRKSKIGFKSPKEALEFQLKRAGIDLDADSIKVKEIKKDGIEMAIALRHMKFFNYWTFLDSNVIPRNENTHFIGTAVEGIRVEFTPPGYSSMNLLSTCNCTGKHSPTTNVARSHFEINSEYSSFLKTVYDIYSEQLSDEMNRMISESISPTKAISEIYYIMAPLISDKNEAREGVSVPIDQELLIQSLLNINIMVIENNKQRLKKSGKEIIQIDELWTIESSKFRKAESFLEEIPENISTTALLGYIDNQEIIDRSNIFCNYRPHFLLHKKVFEEKSLSSIWVDIENRRIDLKWIKKDQDLWDILFISFRTNYSSNGHTYLIQRGDIPIENVPTDTQLIVTQAQRIILKGGVLHEIVDRLISIKNELSPLDLIFFEAVKNKLFLIIDSARQTNWQIDNIEKALFRHLSDGASDYELFSENFYKWIEKDKLINLLLNLANYTLDFSVLTRKYPMFV